MEILLFLLFVVIIPLLVGMMLVVALWYEELYVWFSPFDNNEQMHSFIRQVSYEIKQDISALSLEDKLDYLQEIDIKSISCKKTRIAARKSIKRMTKHVKDDISSTERPVSVVSPISFRK